MWHWGGVALDLVSHGGQVSDRCCGGREDTVCFIATCSLGSSMFSPQDLHPCCLYSQKACFSMTS